MGTRGIFLLGFALFIDGLQAAVTYAAFALGTAMQAITPVGGAVAGAAAGAYACWSASGTVIQGITEAAKCTLPGAVFGAAASAVGLPFGIGLGMALNICISLTFGFALILLLIYNGMFYRSRVFSNGLIEMIPGVDCIPSWTLMVVLCILKNKAEAGKLAGTVTTSSLSRLITTVAPVTGGVLMGVNALQNRASAAAVSSGALTQRQLTDAREERGQRVKTELRNIDGIKVTPSKENLTTPYVQTA